MNSTLIWIVFLGFYVYSALVFQTIAGRTNTPNGWWAWVPILSLFLMLAIAKRPGWWFILFLIPFVGIIPLIILIMDVAQAAGKPRWVGLLTLVPGLNLVVPGYLAWG